MSAPAHARDGAASWIGAPWAGALLRFVADPAADADPAAIAGWPAGAPLDAALGNAFVRGRLGRWLVPDDGNIEGLIDTFAVPAARLALIPHGDAMELIGFLAAWLNAPRLAALIRRSEIQAVRDAIGDDAFAFATTRAALMGQPGALLSDAVERAMPAADRTNPANLPRQGAIAFGLAIGAAPEAVLRRLALRRPAALWSLVGENCREDAAGQDARTCVRRLIRHRARSWSTWLN